MSGPLPHAPLPTPRNVGHRLTDAAFTRLLRLPRPTAEYHMLRDLRIPLRDGVHLLADLFRPGGSSRGLVVVMSPYGWPLPAASMSGGVFARQGYQVLLVRCRGTFGSGGDFDPAAHELSDATDLVAWLRQQPWFEGRFGTYGASYVGFTQWAMLMDSPPELVTAVVATAPHDFHALVHQDGAFALDAMLSWSERAARQEAPPLRRLRDEWRARGLVATAVDDLPLVDAADRLLGDTAPWYRDWVSTRDPEDPLWESMRLTAVLDRVQVPVLVQAGWQDIFIEQSIHQYRSLRERGVDVALTVGPWTHGGYLTRGGRLVVREALDWFDEHLATPSSGGRLVRRPAPVRAAVTGAVNEWLDLPEWPPPTEQLSLHPGPGGTLATRPAPEAARASFTYDPASPAPAVGGPMLLGGGYVQDSSLAEREDVLCFTSEPLRHPVRVLGAPLVELAHQTDNVHADLFVRLSAVDPRGRSRNVCDGFRRLAPASANGVVTIELASTAYELAAGSRIRLLVSGGAHPRWERNLGTGHDPATTTQMASSSRSLDLADCRLVLPIAAGAGQPWDEADLAAGEPGGHSRER